MKFFVIGLVFSALSLMASDIKADIVGAFCALFAIVNFIRAGVELWAHL